MLVVSFLNLKKIYKNSDFLKDFRKFLRVSKDKFHSIYIKVFNDRIFRNVF